MTVQLSRDELRAAIYGLAAVQRARARAGQPVPHPVITARQRLETVYRASPPRQESEGLTPELDAEWIGTRAAAAILDWHPRRVQRHAADLDGQRIGDRLVYPARAIRAYAQHLGRQEEPLT